ncbi:MAG: LysR family transcriptional regulator [Dehalococcoidia bacterium]
MKLRDLQTFYHVARLHSVTKAAQRLHIGQSTVSTHLKNLEGEFGFLLFNRIKYPIRLTSEGDVVFELVAQVMASMDALETYVHSPEHQGSFTIGAFPDPVLHFLPGIIQPFRERYPGVHIRLVTHPYGTLIQMVRSGELDLALSSRATPDDPSLEFVHLFHSGLVLLTLPGHQLLGQKTIQLTDIARWPLILFHPSSHIRQAVEQTLKEQGVSYDVVLEVESAEFMKRYVQIGMGIGVCGEFTLQADDHRHFGVVMLDHLFPTRAYGIYMRKGRAQTPAVLNFIDTLKERSQQAYPLMAETGGSHIGATLATDGE